MEAIHDSRSSPWRVRWSLENRGQRSPIPREGGQGVDAWRFGEVSYKEEVIREGKIGNGLNSHWEVSMSRGLVPQVKS
jgi:hypothetical protein